MAMDSFKLEVDSIAAYPEEGQSQKETERALFTEMPMDIAKLDIPKKKKNYLKLSEVPILD